LRFKCMVRIELDLFRKQRTSRSDRIGRSSVSKSALMAGIVTRRFSVCSFHYISVARIAVLSFITRTSDIACSTSRGGLFVSFFSPNCRRGLVEAPRPVSVSAHSRSSRYSRKSAVRLCHLMAYIFRTRFMPSVSIAQMNGVRTRRHL
jgi:hypothetical protein